MRSFGAAWKEGDVIGVLFSAKDSSGEWRHELDNLNDLSYTIYMRVVSEILIR